MKLTVLERAIALSTLPEQGDFATLKVVQQARTNLSLSEKEVEEFEFKTEEGRMKWNAKGQEEKEIDLSKTAVKLIREKLEEIDSKKELKEQQLSTYEKFTA